MAANPSAQYDSGNETVFGPGHARTPAENMPPLPASLGPYEVVKTIGHGGMGLVLQCRDNALKRDVAIKILRKGDRDDTVARMRFIKEAQITGQLEHPGIVSVHYLGWDDGDREFFSMKLVAGRTLDKVLDLWHANDKATRAALPLSRLVSILERICEAIGFAHSRGVIHRDLKPSNIMIGEYGEVWVLDWGLAKILSEEDAPVSAPEIEKHNNRALPSDLGNDVTLDGTIVGTPEYMAPEQACGQPLDEGVDIFGLGALLYEMLTGTTPHTGKTVNEIVNRAAEARIVAVKRTRRGRKAPRALAAMAHKCLALHREDRYASVEELLRDVRAYTAGERVSALPETAFDRAQRFLRQHSRAVAAGIVVSLALLIVVSVSAVLVGNKDREARRAEALQQQERAARLEAELEKQKTLAATAEKARSRLAAFTPYSQAMDLLMRGQLSDKAASLLNDALAIDSNFPEAQFALGEALRACGRPLDAAAAYLKADAMSRAMVGRPNLHAMVAAGFALDGAGSYADAEDAFARAEKEGANDPLALVGRVFRLAHNQKLFEARSTAEEALKLAPHLWETHFAVGYALMENIDGGVVSPADWRKPAIDELKKALELSPRQAEIWSWLAVAVSHIGTREARAEAVSYAERAIKLEPLNGNRFISRAGFKLSSGDIPGADQDIAEAKRLGVTPFLVQIYEARRAGARGDMEEAFRLLTDVVHNTREWPAHVANLAIVGFKLKKFDEIKPAIEHLAAQHPNYPLVFVLRGALKSEDGDFAAAAAEAREGLKSAPYHGQLRTMLATWLHRARQFKDALEATESALDISPSDGPLKMQKLDCLYKLRRKDEAIAYTETLKKEYPEKALEIDQFVRSIGGGQ